MSFPTFPGGRSRREAPRFPVVKPIPFATVKTDPRRQDLPRPWTDKFFFHDDRET